MQLARTLVVAALPKKPTEAAIIAGFDSIGVKAEKVEIILNPDRAARNLGAHPEIDCFDPFYV